MQATYGLVPAVALRRPTLTFLTIANAHVPMIVKHQLTVDRNLDRIDAAGQITYGSVHRLLALIHHAIDAGFDEVTLSLTDCTGAWPGPMLQLCAQAMAYRDAGNYVWLELPENQKLARLFLNANWANLIDPRRYDEGRFRGISKLPATQYRTPSEQHQMVNQIVQAALASTTNCERSEIRAFEWAINEVTDNVIVHAKSSCGGLVQVSTFPQRRHIMFAVADAGMTIPATLRGGHPDIVSDTEALEQALREGVTRDTSIGQGNGLFGTYRICQRGRGSFVLDSRYAYATYSPKKGLHIRNTQIPYRGTLVVAELDFSQPGLLEDALKIAGKVKRPVDFIETHYESDDGQTLHVRLADEAKSFGSRAAGEPLRRRLENLARMTTSNRIDIDFDGIPLVSSSFADEVIAKLFVQFGPISFMKRFRIVNADETVSELIDKAIRQRTRTGL